MPIKHRSEFSAKELPRYIKRVTKRLLRDQSGKTFQAVILYDEQFVHGFIIDTEADLKKKDDFL